MGLFQTTGPKTALVTDLLWGLTGLSIFVVLVISVLVVTGVLRRRARAGGPHESVPVERSGSGLPWIVVGVGLSAVALLGFMVWTVVTMAAISRPPGPSSLTIEIIAQQWWWEVRYPGEEPSRAFETANEIHIPVGQPVHVKLRSKDVIHSFWIPALGGKTDAIPGQINTMWLEANEPGVYRGQCAEYCGVQHAHMALKVFAEPPDVFDRWRRKQLQPAQPPEAPSARQGQQTFIARCGACHTVRGTLAGGELGPDLTHLMSRTSIAAVTRENTIAHLSGWIANPQGIKPGSRMPNPELSGPELARIRSFLETLD